VVASVQTGVPVAQPSVPAWQRLVGAQLVPSLQVTHSPAEQTIPVPHPAPSCWLPLSTHVETPLTHDVVPAWHAVATWHDLPAAHAPHVPELQTLSVPHDMPLLTFVPKSVHETVGEHAVTPLWQGLAGTHDSPPLHVTHAPPLHTMPAPQVAPLVRLSDSMQTGLPVLQAVVPVRHGLPGTSHTAPLTHATHAPVALQTLSFPHVEPGARFVVWSVHEALPCEQSREPT
jgi:hypothetical protein